MSEYDHDSAPHRLGDFHPRGHGTPAIGEVGPAGRGFHGPISGICGDPFYGAGNVAGHGIGDFHAYRMPLSMPGLSTGGGLSIPSAASTQAAAGPAAGVPPIPVKVNADGGGGGGGALLMALAQVPFGVYVGIGALTGAYALMQNPKTAGWLVGVVVGVGALFGGLALWIRRRRKQEEYLLANNASLAQIREMSWCEFEKLITRYFELLGYCVRKPVPSMSVGEPREMVVEKGRRRVLVNCRALNQKLVPVRVVRETFGIMAASGGTEAAIVTTGQFTVDAQRWGAHNGMHLINGKRLEQLVLDAAQAESARKASELANGGRQGCVDARMVLRLLFLDFDGVLHIGDSGTLRYMPNLIRVLKLFPEYEVVVSSTWRTSHTLDELRTFFPINLRARIRGVTPMHPYACKYQRYYEILDYLNTIGHDVMVNWVAIDDCPEDFPSPCERLFAVHRSYALDEVTTERLVTFIKQREDDFAELLKYAVDGAEDNS
jgi:hypothetical protein